MNNTKNVMIFIDYENIHKNFIKQNQNALGTFFFYKLKKWCEKNNLRILDTKIYCNFDIEDLYESHHQSKLQEYGLETFHTANKGKNYSDLKITADLLEELYENSKIDGFIVISNDKDMTPLIKIIKRYKEFIYLITNKDCYDIALKNFPDKILTLEDNILSEISEEEIQEEIKEYEKIEDLIVQSLEEFITKNSSNLKNRDINFILKSNVAYFKIPIYEILKFYKNAVINSKLILFTYSYNGKNSYSLCPTSKKNDYINKKLLEEKNIIPNTTIENFFDQMIERYYSEYQKKFDK